MNEISSFRAIPMKPYTTLLLGAVAALSLLVGCRPTPTTGGDQPVTTERLTGRHLVDIRRKVSWTFSDTEVVIQNQEQPIPPDVVHELLGNRSTPMRIEATWRFDENTKTLRLSDAKADGTNIGVELSIPIQPAGQVRVNLGTRQYNLFRDSDNVP